MEVVDQSERPIVVQTAEGRVATIRVKTNGHVANRTSRVGDSAGDGGQILLLSRWFEIETEKEWGQGRDAKSPGHKPSCQMQIDGHSDHSSGSLRPRAWNWNRCAERS